MILRARSVVTMNGPPIENGAVAVSGNRIIDVGTFAQVSARNFGTIIDLGEQALLPGLINAHCHLDYTCLRGKIAPQQSFTDWIRAINTEKAKLSANDYLGSINQGFQEAKKFGATTIANLTAVPALIAQIREPIRTWWFAELIDVRDPTRASEIVDRSVKELRIALECDDASPLLRRGHVRALQKDWGLAPHAPFTASRKLYRRCDEVASEKNVLLTTHLAESREEMSMFRDARGPLYDFLKGIGRDMSDCDAETPTSYFLKTVTGSSTHSNSLRARLSLGITNDWLLVHMNELSESDFDLVEKSGTKFSIVHCPRSHNYFGHSLFQFERLKNLGLNICLGTDSLASNDDLSLFGELRAFRQKFPNVPADEILAMVTTNAARALRQENALGRIARDFFADLIAIPCSGSTNIFEEIVAFKQAVSWSMLDGVI
jgi:cytosine/adenosine deaminase-related metal-dependent hydrolase